MDPETFKAAYSNLPSHTMDAAFYDFMSARLEAHAPNEATLQAQLSISRDSFRKKLAMHADKENNFGAFGSLAACSERLGKDLLSFGNGFPAVTFFRGLYTIYQTCTGDATLHQPYNSPSTHAQLLAKAGSRSHLLLDSSLKTFYHGNLQQFFWEVIGFKAPGPSKSPTCWRRKEGELLCPGHASSAPDIFLNLPLLLMFEDLEVSSTGSKEDDDWDYPLRLRLFPKTHVIANSKGLSYELIGRVYLQSDHFTGDYSIDQQHVYSYNGMKHGGKAVLLEGNSCTAKFALGGLHAFTYAALYRLKGGRTAQETFTQHQAKLLEEAFQLTIHRSSTTVWPTITSSRPGAKILATEDLFWLHNPNPYRARQELGFDLPRSLDTLQ
ncbi:hypothetical protein CALVIDRAFT_527831, partial [Calocera viscosa TUFC12733]